MTYDLALFPGQGAQHIGMGKEIYEASPVAQDIFNCASDISHTDVKKLCFETDINELSKTINSQIAIFTHSIAVYSVLKERDIKFRACAGFSLGEYTALTAANVMSFEDGIKIVAKRGQVMQKSADKIDGAMYAILGLDDEIVEKSCAQVTNGVVLPVNYNCNGQIVIAGEKQALEKAAELCKQNGAKRVLPLAVSGAFHTPLLKDAAQELKEFLKDIKFSKPTMPIYTNVTGQTLNNQDIASHLEQHMISPVRWKTIMQNCVKSKLMTGCEIGVGKTLTGFAKKIDKEISIFPIETMENVETLNQ